MQDHIGAAIDRQVSSYMDPGHPKTRRRERGTKNEWEAIFVNAIQRKEKIESTIISLNKRGVGTRLIAQELNVPRAMIRRILAQHT